MIILKEKNFKRKIPTVLQMEAVECGAASLAMILGYYGAHIPLEKLRIECGVSRDGSKASNLLKVARNYGLIAKGFKTDLQKLKSFDHPCIIHWNFNHFLVLDRIVGDFVYLVDPSSGPKRVSLDELDLSFTGVVLVFEPSVDFKKIGEPAKMHKMLSTRIKGSKKEMVYLLLVGLCLSLPGMLTPIFSKVFVDDILLSHRDEWLMPLLAGMTLATVLRGFLTWLREFYLLRFESKLSITNASKYLWHVLHLPVEFFNQRFAGDISSRMESNERIAMALSGKITSSVLNCIMLIFYVLLMLYYNVPLTILAILIALLNFYILQKITIKRKDLNQKKLLDKGKLHGTSISGIKTIETLKATGSEMDFFEKWSGYHAKVLNGAQEIGVSSQLLLSVPSLLSKLCFNSVLIFGGYKIIRGEMTIGSLVAFQSLMVSFMQPVIDLVNLVDELQQLRGDMIRIDDVLNYSKDSNFASVCDDAPLKSTHLEKLSGHVVVEDLSFGYNPLDAPLIEGFNIKIKPGERIALVGGSGSGKSTIARIISGLYKPWSGKVTFDSMIRTEIGKVQLVNSIAVVDQNISMFNASIKENITLWNKHVSDYDVIQACKDACIHDDITKKDGGYNHIVSEGGTNFSGGQRQRLEIARALALNPSILILDEATSALDPQTERRIDENIRRRGCTCIIVAHRLSTVRDCDEIIVLEWGKIIERGTHECLKQGNGHYMTLLDAR